LSYWVNKIVAIDIQQILENEFILWTNCEQ